MSVNKPASSTAPQPPNVNATSDAAPTQSSPNVAPTLQLREQAPLPGWRDLPQDVLGLLIKDLITQAMSVLVAPASRFEALQALLQLGAVAHQEKNVLQAFLENNPLDIDAIRNDVLAANREVWKGNATAMARQRERLLEDFSATREALESTAASGLPPAFPPAFDAVHLCFREIACTPAIEQLMSGLEGKTVKIDATAIGRGRFLVEALPVLSKLPVSCKVILEACDNGLTAPDLQRLAGVMTMKPCVYRLDLSRNPLSDGGNYQLAFVQLFRNAGPLTHLYLAETGFDDEAAFALKDSLIHAKHLVHLDLRNNLLDEEGVLAMIRAVLPDVKDLKQLERLEPLRIVRLGGNPYQDETAIKAAASRFVNDLDKLHETVFYRDVAQGVVREYPSATPDIFQIYLPSTDVITQAQIRMYDRQAERDRL